MADPAHPQLEGTYSERTKCPACGTKVRLEDVRPTGSFPCPNCSQTLRVSIWYQRGVALTNSAIGLFVAYKLGVSAWLVPVLALPITFAVLIPMMVLSKLLVPPHLKCDTTNYSGPLGLGRS